MATSIAAAFKALGPSFLKGTSASASAQAFGAGGGRVEITPPVGLLDDLDAIIAHGADLCKMILQEAVEQAIAALEQAAADPTQYGVRQAINALREGAANPIELVNDPEQGIFRFGAGRIVTDYTPGSSPPDSILLFLEDYRATHPKTHGARSAQRVTIRTVKAPKVARAPRTTPVRSYQRHPKQNKAALQAMYTRNRAEQRAIEARLRQRNVEQRAIEARLRTSRTEGEAEGLRGQRAGFIAGSARLRAEIMVLKAHLSVEAIGRILSAEQPVRSSRTFVPTRRIKTSKMRDEAGVTQTTKTVVEGYHQKYTRAQKGAAHAYVREVMAEATLRGTETFAHPISRLSPNRVRGGISQVRSREEIGARRFGRVSGDRSLTTTAKRGTGARARRVSVSETFHAFRAIPHARMRELVSLMVPAEAAFRPNTPSLTRYVRGAGRGARISVPEIRAPRIVSVQAIRRESNGLMESGQITTHLVGMGPLKTVGGFLSMRREIRSLFANNGVAQNFLKEQFVNLPAESRHTINAMIREFTADRQSTDSLIQGNLSQAFTPAQARAINDAIRLQYLPTLDRFANVD